MTESRKWNKHGGVDKITKSCRRRTYVERPSAWSAERKSPKDSFILKNNDGALMSKPMCVALGGGRAVVYVS